MKLFVFLGPTLPADEAVRHLDATFLPPASQGDVYRITNARPFAIGIIDGLFERVPAIWHKEVLWALTQGIHVFGGSSMGALRAAELAPFGMRGVGRIFEAFHSGELEDDDEVAVAHGDASVGYRPTSEAMVNVRATLEGAKRAGVIVEKERLELVALAKGLFYPDRSFARLLADARASGMREQTLRPLQEFVRDNRVDQKRMDALALLSAMKQCCSDGAPPPAPAFTFARTEAWDAAVASAQGQAAQLGTNVAPEALIAAEVRLLGGVTSQKVLAGALARASAAIALKGRASLQRAAKVTDLDRRVRQSAGSDSSPEAFEQWLATQGLTSTGYRGYLERTADLAGLRELCRPDLDLYVVDELRATDEYRALAARADDKDRVLSSRGLADPTLEDAGVGRQELLSWYFEQRTGTRTPTNLKEFLLESGVSDAATLQREALRELLYARIIGNES